MASPQIQLSERDRLGLITPDSPQNLYEFQLEGLSAGLAAPGRFFFLSWDTGTGKSRAAAALCQELIANRNEVDIAIIYTLRLNKINLCRTVNENTVLTARNIEGSKDKRKKEYEKRDADVLVMNYEKSNFDFEELKKLIKGKKVLFILDEVQKILLPNKASQAFKKILRSVRNPYCWAMSASAVNGDPLRYWRLFDFMKENPLGTQHEFRNNYVQETRVVSYGWRQQFIDIWDEEKLKDIPARVAPWTHTVRKSDPGIREHFKNTDFIIERVQLSPKSRALYSIIEELALHDDGSHAAQLFSALRYCCNSIEAFNYSDNEIAKLIRQEGLVFTSNESQKFEQVIDKIEQIRDQGDKAIVFTQWTHLSLFPFSRMLDQHGIRHVVHYGTGMSSAEAQRAQDSFKSDPAITVFLSSDAGSHGLNFQQARYVLHIECPHSYDLLTQRSDRIDRIDSYLDGLTTYLFICENTIEERIWAVNNYRRKLTGTIQGTLEINARPPVEDIDSGLRNPDQARWLLTGK